MIENEIKKIWIIPTYPDSKLETICAETCFEFQLAGFDGICRPEPDGRFRVTCPEEIEEDVRQLIRAMTESIQEFENKYGQLEVAKFNYGFAKMYSGLLLKMEEIAEYRIDLESAKLFDPEVMPFETQCLLEVMAEQVAKKNGKGDFEVTHAMLEAKLKEHVANRK